VEKINLNKGYNTNSILYFLGSMMKFEKKLVEINPVKWCRIYMHYQNLKYLIQLERVKLNFHLVEIFFKKKNLPAVWDDQRKFDSSIGRQLVPKFWGKIQNKIEKKITIFVKWWKQGGDQQGCWKKGKEK